MAAGPATFPMAPPEVRAQQTGAPPTSVFMQPIQGAGVPTGGQLIGQLEQKANELEAWAGETARLIAAVQPSLGAFLVPIAQAGKALQAEVGQLKQRLGQGPSLGPMSAPTMPTAAQGGVPPG